VVGARAAHRRELLPKIVFRFVTDISQLPALVQRFLSFGFAQRFLVLHPGALAIDAVCASVLFDRQVQGPQRAVQHFAECALRPGKIDAACIRYLELLMACEAGGRALPEAPAEPAPVQARTSRSSRAAGVPGPNSETQEIRVRALDLRAPDGLSQPLAHSVAFSTDAASPLVITGPSRSGKSLLGRVLLGLQPAGQGAEVSVAGLGARPPLRALSPVPERPYLVAGGRLMAQLAYPNVLRSPASPPFEVSVEGAATEAALLEHFRPMGALAVRAVGEARAVVSFQSIVEVWRAVARPQDRVIGGIELQCEVCDSPEAHWPAVRLGRMRQCLRVAGLESLLLHEPDGWLARRPWEELLTWPEQQRLCIARGLYHAQAFVLLDDCTSALPPLEEQVLCRQIQQVLGVAPIAISRRAFAPDVFSMELRLGESGSPGRWLLGGVEQLETQ